jgi:hypothetical protein
MFIDESDLLDLDKEINEVGLGFDVKEKRAKDAADAKGGPTGAGSYGRHSVSGGTRDIEFVTVVGALHEFPPMYPAPPSSSTPRGSVSDSRTGSSTRGKIKAPAGPPPSTLRPTTADIKDVPAPTDDAVKSLP